MWRFDRDAGRRASGEPKAEPEAERIRRDSDAMGSVGAFGMILAGAGLVGIVASYIWGMAGAKK